MRYYTGGTGSSSTWQPVELFVDGDAIINGTIAANKLVANTITASQIAAGTITGNEISSGTRITIGGSAGQDVVILDASDANSRIWVGNTTATSANFRVSPTGDLYANNGYFGGEVTYQGITGAIGGAVDSSLTSAIPDWSEWFVDSAVATPTAIMARVTIPRQNYDRVAVVTCIPSLLIATSRTNVDRFGIVWTAANSTGSTLDYHYRVTSVTESGVGYTTTGNAASAFEFVAQNANQAWFKLTNTLAWEVFIPATTATGNLTIDLKAQFLHATGQSFPVSNFVTFKVPNSTVNVEVSKVNSGISISN
ncbi:tail fiber protein [Vibrio phage VpJYP1]|nr:tail fiber protein [Vibrio phage VpJYP1]